jgi:hypothetical protein
MDVLTAGNIMVGVAIDLIYLLIYFFANVKVNMCFFM